MLNGISLGFVGFGEAAYHIIKGLRQQGVDPLAAHDFNTHTPGVGERIRSRAEETGTILPTRRQEPLSKRLLI